MPATQKRGSRMCVYDYVEPTHTVLLDVCCGWPAKSRGVRREVQRFGAPRPALAHTQPQHRLPHAVVTDCAYTTGASASARPRRGGRGCGVRRYSAVARTVPPVASIA